MAKEAYQINIDWLWTNFDGPGPGETCSDYVVYSPDPLIVRNGTTGHDCVVSSIRAHRAARYYGLALSWLCAGQCHNNDALESIRRAGDAAVSYAVTTYGPQVP